MAKKAHQLCSGTTAKISILISLLAVLFTGLQWYEAHQQKRLSTKPLITFSIEDDMAEPRRGLAIENHGTGPAVIKSVRYFVDQKLISDEDEVLKYGKFDPEMDYGIDLEDDDVIGVGQRVWLIDYRSKNGKEIDRLSVFLSNRIAVEVSYCSIDDECGRKCSSKGKCQ